MNLIFLINDDELIERHEWLMYLSYDEVEVVDADEVDDEDDE